MADGYSTRVIDQTVSVGSSLTNVIVIEATFLINNVVAVSVPSGVTGEIWDSATVTNGAYRISWTPTTAGTYSLVYRVEDVWGNYAEEVTVTVTVIGAEAADETPYISGPTSVNVYYTGSASYEASGGTFESSLWSVSDPSGTVTQWIGSGSSLGLYFDSATEGGTVVISVTNDQGYVASLAVAVTNDEMQDDTPEGTLVTRIVIDGDDGVEGGGTIGLTATTYPDDADDRTVSWDVSSPELMITGTSDTSTGGTVTLLASEVEYDTEVIVTATARDGSGTYATHVVTIHGYMVGLDANGGTFPNGKEVVELEPPDGYIRLPDWSVVDRAGYRLTGWTSGSRSGAMAEQVTTGGMWTAVWTRDTRGYDTEYLPHVSIRIYRALDEYIDATYLQVEGGQASVSIAEDETGSASFVLVNDYQTGGHNLMSSSCSLWSSGGNGAIRPGMYVRIDDIRSDGTVEYLFDGFITTLSPDADRISVECGDRITFLGKQGTTLRRNYYGGLGGRSSAFVSAGNDGDLYADLSELPEGAVVDGTIYWTIPSVAGYRNDTYIDVPYRTQSSPLFVYTFPTGGEYLDNVTLIMALYNFHTARETTLTFTVTSGSSSRTISLVTSDRDSFTVSLDLDMMPCGSTATVTAYSNMAPSSGNFALRVSRTSNSPSTCIVTRWTASGVEQSFNYAVAGSTTAYTLASTEGSVSGTRYYPSRITDVRSLDDESLYVPSASRVYVPYVISGIQSTVDVMEGIAWAMEHLPLATDALAREETLVTIYRTGGGYAQDYLQKLADIASEDGRMRAYLSRGYKTPVLVISGRYDRMDTSQAHIGYGGDALSSAYGDIVYFSAFSPSMTLKNRPSLVTLRGTISEQGSSESVPLQIAVEDIGSTDARYGVLVETVAADSSVSSMGDAGQAAWSALAESYLDEWEGTVTVPGIRRDMMVRSGDYAGSGVPITLTDTRNGLSAYRARVRQVRMDYNACTTTLTISNYSMVHSSGIADTTALAITATDVSTGDTSTTLFNAQYVRIRTDSEQNLGDGTQVTVTGIKGDGGTFAFDSVSVFSLPNGRHLVHAVAYQDSSGHTDDDRAYDVVAVRIGTRAQLDIRQSLRPDWYRGQTLSVDVDCP